MSIIPEELFIQPVSGLYVHTPKNGNISFPNRNFHALVMYKTGICDYRYETFSFQAEPGSILFLPEGLPYAIFPKGESDCMCFNFHCPEMLHRAPFCIKPEDHSHIQFFFDRCIKRWIDHEIGYKFQCLSDLFLIFAELQRNDGHDISKRHTIMELQKAYTYIHEHYRMPHLKIAEIARICNMSERSFRSKFTYAYNVPPMKYITNLRMAYAVELLKSAEFLSITDIAAACGYNDLFYFSRLFKEYYHVSPNHYKKLNL